jgi:UDP-N-acetylglucosamine 2-epimerase (non-hydrolysing)
VNVNMKMMIIVGARPNFMKAAPIIAACRSGKVTPQIAAGAEVAGRSNGEIDVVLVHTGQHYDEAMSTSFFTDLGLPKPDVYLGVGSGTHAVQTAEIMRQFEGVVLGEKPDVVLVVGDVNSTVACALVAAKIAYDTNGTRPLIVHVEAGLRSFDRAMPEEVNRIVTDHVSDMLFVTEESGVENLLHEGIPAEKIHFVGNTMIDSLLFFKDKANQSQILEKLGLREANGTNGSGRSAKRFALLTLHRPSNVDDRETFLNILEGIKELAATCPIVFSAHPRTRKRIEEFGLQQYFQLEPGSTADTGIRLLEPLGYLDFVCLMQNAAMVVTDSGGIQEETTCLGVPCITVRENTERPVTITCGTNTLAGTKKEKIREVVRQQRQRPASGRVPEKWDGKAGARIVEAIAAEVARKSPEPALR